jgi:hypothetical protein
VSTGTIHYWINSGYLHARRGAAGRWAVPLPGRSRGRLPRPRHRLRPPAPRHRPRPAGRRRAQHRRGRPPPRRQARRHLRMGRMGPRARPPRPRRAAVDPLHPRRRAGMPPANRQLIQAPRRH